MGRSPHIGFITTSFPRYDGDTAGSFVFGMARAFQRSGINVDVVVPEPSDRADWHLGRPWLQDIRITAVPYARPRSLERLFFGAGVPDNLDQHPWTAALVPAACAQMVHATVQAMRHWDAVVSHWLVPSSLIVALAQKVAFRKATVPHLAVAHSGDVHLLSLPLLCLLAHMVPKTASTLGFVSSSLRQRFLNNLGPVALKQVLPMTRITPMGIEMQELLTSRPRKEIRAGLGIRNFAVLFLGRMVPIKGLGMLIDAAAGQSGFQFIAAGDGPERASLEHRAKSRKVNVRFLGAVDPKRRAELFRACDALVVPSIVLPNGRSEGLPMVILEAMAAGIPVVASNTGSASELVVHQETGLLFEQRDQTALMRCLTLLRDSPTMRRTLRAAAKKRAAERDWHFVIKDILPLLGLS